MQKKKLAEKDLKMIKILREHYGVPWKVIESVYNVHRSTIYRNVKMTSKQLATHLQNDVILSCR